MKINTVNELKKFVDAGKIFGVASTVDSLGIYFQDGDKIREVFSIENDDIPGEYLLHGEVKKNELLNNIVEFNQGMERATIVIEELTSFNIPLPLQI